MEDNLLFVYRDPEVVEKFLKRMVSFELSIDTAMDGQDALDKMEKKEYKILITGMKLEHVDGMKLLEHVNRDYPKTVCMVYTSRMDLARLKFLVNQREVFRIFLRPVNYHGEFYESIQEAFEFYNMAAAEQQEQTQVNQQRIMYQGILESLRKLTGRKQQNIRLMQQFLLPVVKLSVQKFSCGPDQSEMHQIVKYEYKILSYYLRSTYSTCDGLKDLEHFIREEFASANTDGQFEFDLHGAPTEATGLFYQELRYIIWLLLEQYITLVKRYEVRIRVETVSKGRAEITLEICLSPGILKTCQSQPFLALCTELAQSIAGEIAEKLECEKQEGRICYRLEMETDRQCHFMEEDLSAWTTD